MNKSIVRSALIIILFGGELARAATSQFRTPLTFIKHGSLHYPLGYVEQAWWIDLIDQEKRESRWHIDSFQGLYSRSATKSFLDTCNPCTDKTTHKTVSLSTLWFGKEAFRGEDVFPGGMLKNPCDFSLQKKENIALGFSRITPRFEYSENGVFVGVDVSRSWGDDNQWHLRAHVGLPIVVIDIKRNQTQTLYETVDDVVMMRPIKENGDEKEYDFAARFDFLNTLSYRDENGSCIPFVQYNKDKSTVKMAGLDSSGASPEDPGAVFAISSFNGALPDQPFRKTSAQEHGIVPLPASGALSDNTIAFFSNNTNYNPDGTINKQAFLGTNRDAQGQLFIVPHATPDDESLTMQSESVSQQLQVLLEQINGLGYNTPVNFFRKAGNINLAASDRITGQGDLFMELYGGYMQNNWFLDGIFGLRFPTDVSTDEVHKIFAQATGNNDHLELKLGIDGGWKVCDWFAFEIDVAYHHAFTRTEQRAAPYKGATVKNIGPRVGVDVSWDYFTAHANLNFIHPYNPELGCMIGYDFFGKRKDKICIQCPPPNDLLGRPNDTLLPIADQGYDPSLLSEHTNSLTHKIRGEIFHRWNFCEFFAGAGQVLAGKNAMKESEAYLGVNVYF